MNARGFGAFVSVVAVALVLCGCTGPKTTSSFASIYVLELSPGIFGAKTNCTVDAPVPLLGNGAWYGANISAAVGSTRSFVNASYGPALELKGPGNGSAGRLGAGGAAQLYTPPPSNLSMQATPWNATGANGTFTARFHLYVHNCVGYSLSITYKFDTNGESRQIDIEAPVVGGEWQSTIGTLGPYQK